MGENTKYMLDDLDWLGLAFDGEVLWQSQRSEIYADYFAELEQKGLIYPCYCSRAELHAASAPHLSDGVPLYDRKCLLRAERGELPPVGRKPSYRVRVPDKNVEFTDILQGEYRENLDRECSDFVVRRSDGVYAYQLAVVVDDALSGVNEVVRGKDLLSSTPRQMYLQDQWGFAHPTYAHIPLLTDAAGRRLSKREGDGCMDRVREVYPDARPVIGALAASLGLIPSPESMTVEQLLPLFDWEKIPRDAVLLPEGF
jgi:glutamyl-tRNA synthetase